MRTLMYHAFIQFAYTQALSRSHFALAVSIVILMNVRITFLQLHMHFLVYSAFFNINNPHREIEVEVIVISERCV